MVAGLLAQKIHGRNRNAVPVPRLRRNELDQAAELKDAEGGSAASDHRAGDCLVGTCNPTPVEQAFMFGLHQAVLKQKFGSTETERD